MELAKSVLDLLVEHIDGPVPVIVRNPKRRHRAVPGGGGPGLALAGRIQVTQVALRKGYLRYNEPMTRRHTVITEVGRGALAKDLGELIDVLVRAGLDIENPSPAIPFRLAELRKWASSRGFRAAQDYSHI